VIVISEENVKTILDTIEDLVLNSPKIPIFNKLILDEDKLFSLLDTLRQQLPKEMSEAQTIVMNRDKLLLEANNRAKEMIAAAEQRAKVLVSNNEIVKKSLQEAESLKYEVNLELEKNQDEADKYADQVLENLENKIVNALSEIKNGRDRLSQV
jgi:hypothetical protein